jgi:hypothetical protein
MKGEITVRKHKWFVIAALLLAMNLVFTSVTLASYSSASYTVDCDGAYFTGTVVEGQQIRLEVRLYNGPINDPLPTLQDDYIVITALGPFDVTVPWVANPDGRLHRVAVSYSTNGGQSWINIAVQEVEITCAPDFEGCTPGGWRGGNLQDKWNQDGDPDWDPAQLNPFSHGTLFNDYFTLWGSLDTLTMFDLVAKGGGKDTARKAARSLVAAYLNASHAGINYPKTIAELETMWNDAVASGAFADLHTELDLYNNYGCFMD